MEGAREGLEAAAAGAPRPYHHWLRQPISAGKGALDRAAASALLCYTALLLHPLRRGGQPRIAFWLLCPEAMLHLRLEGAQAQARSLARAGTEG